MRLPLFQAAEPLAKPPEEARDKSVRKMYPDVWRLVAQAGEDHFANARRIALAAPLARALPGLGLAAELRVAIAEDKSYQSIAGRVSGRDFLLRPRRVFAPTTQGVHEVLRAHGSLALRNVPTYGPRTVLVDYKEQWNSPTKPYQFSKNNVTYAPEQRRHFRQLLQACGPALKKLDLSGSKIMEFYRTAEPTRTNYQPDMEAGRPAPSVHNFDWDRLFYPAVEKGYFDEDFASMTQLRHLAIGGTASTTEVLALLNALYRAGHKHCLELDVLDISGGDAASLLVLPTHWSIKTLLADNLVNKEIDNFNPFDPDSLVRNARQQWLDRPHHVKLPNGLAKVSLVGSPVNQLPWAWFVQALLARNVEVERSSDV